MCVCTIKAVDFSRTGWEFALSAIGYIDYGRVVEVAEQDESQIRTG